MHDVKCGVSKKFFPEKLGEFDNIDLDVEANIGLIRLVIVNHAKVCGIKTSSCAIDTKHQDVN